jgi:hypothetical protein
LFAILSGNTGMLILFDWSSIYHNYVYHNTVGAVTVLFLCRHRDTVIHSQMLCEWLCCSCFVIPTWVKCSTVLCELLLYIRCVVFRKQLTVPLCYLSGSSVIFNSIF